MIFKRKLPIPQEVKAEFPLSDHLAEIKAKNDEEIRKIFTGESDKFLLVIGPCSADREDAVMEYTHRLKKLSEQVQDKILIIPRVYTGKPRTTGEGYKGLVHQPNSKEPPDMMKGIVAIRKIHMRVLEETGFSTADEMLYPENHRYISDLLSYVAVGARSVENQQHRLLASGLDVPVGMKNPTSGDISVMMNAIKAGQSSHMFIYRGWEVESAGNPYAHAILRGYVNKNGESQPNYHYEDLSHLYDNYMKMELQNPTAIVDCSHSNCAKHYKAQIRIAKEICHNRQHSKNIHSLVKGLMIESYLEDGAQKIGESVYGKSITDPCIGWAKTEKLVLDIADLV
ncbi:MAG: 3-deoxy-7-phosphoheptulonate synthase [Clostridia bacterium]|nr:3-deoxy-7-phosphoheptulonate synthase [Clostridia bacterium]